MTSKNFIKRRVFSEVPTMTFAHFFCFFFVFFLYIEVIDVSHRQLHQCIQFNQSDESDELCYGVDSSFRVANEKPFPPSKS